MKRKLWIILALTALILALGVGAALADQSGTCGTNVTWTYTEANHKLTISGTGAMADYTSTSSAPAPWSSFNAEIQTVEIRSGVTGIGDYAFGGCSGLTSVTLPSGVTSIGRYAFRGCSGLTSITIPSGVTSIGSSAFEGCSSLSSITIPSGVTSIGGYAFQNCSSLTSVAIPSGVTTIGSSAFYGCSSLTSVTIPGSVTSIGRYAFGNTALSSVTLPVSVTSIGGRAFYACNSLTSVTVMDPACAIGEGSYNVFDGCANTVTLRGWPDSTAQAYVAASANTAFESIGTGGTCGEGVYWSLDTTTWKLTISGSGAMTDYARGAAPWWANRSDIRSLKVKDGVTALGNYAFYGCSDLTSATIPASVARIGISAFNGCYYLIEFRIPNPDAVIESNAFAGCSNLTLYGLAGSTTEAYAANTVNPCGFELLAPAPDFILPSALTSIELDAFVGISAHAVVIPRNIQSITGNPFAGSSVEYIYGFPGTAAETWADSNALTFFSLTDAWYARLKAR